MNEPNAPAEAVNVASAFRSDWSAEPQPTLATPRLLLRAFALTDARRVTELAGDRAIADTTTLPHPYADGLAADWIATHEPQ